MRIISGSARGRRLKELQGMDTRPTTDKVKEALFNIIQFEIEGRRVLDLFGGTGQLGLEALSRGADTAPLPSSGGRPPPSSGRISKPAVFRIGPMWSRGMPSRSCPAAGKNST